jgi:hypothetical protein
MNAGKGDTRRPTDEKKVAENWPADLGPEDGKVKRFHKVYGGSATTAHKLVCSFGRVNKFSPYIEYVHHGAKVTVREDLKGTHRDHCLCFSCAKFRPNNHGENCRVANDTFANCAKHNLTTPVFECLNFVEGEPDAS